MDLLESGGGKGERKKKEKINSFIQTIMKFKICPTTEREGPRTFHDAVFKFYPGFSFKK